MHTTPTTLVRHISLVRTQLQAGHRNERDHTRRGGGVMMTTEAANVQPDVRRSPSLVDRKKEGLHHRASEQASVGFHYLAARRPSGEYDIRKKRQKMTDGRAQGVTYGFFP